MRRAREEREQRERLAHKLVNCKVPPPAENSFFSRNTSSAAARTLECERKALNVSELLKRPPPELLGRDRSNPLDNNEKSAKREEALRSVARELRWPSFSGGDSEKQYMMLSSEPGIDVSFLT